MSAPVRPGRDGHRGPGDVARRVAVAPIAAYRRWISPLKPAPTCRFHPTCSAYAQEAVLTHGILRGTVLAVQRILKCHPWHPGGLDPVPGRTTQPGPRLPEES